MNKYWATWQRVSKAVLIAGCIAGGTAEGWPAVGARTVRAAPPGQDAGDAIPGVTRFDGISAAHVAGPIDYERLPPPGGPHNPVWVNCGVYLQPVPTEMAVHSLEHGAVWITYRPDLPPPAVQTLAELTRGQTHVLVSPWGGPSLASDVVASAWGLQLATDDATDPRLAEFVHRYAEGPQTPEPGAPCRGAAGTPITLP